MLHFDDGTETFKASNVLYDGTCPDATTPGKWDLGMSKASKQWANTEETGAKTID